MINSSADAVPRAAKDTHVRRSLKQSNGVSCETKNNMNSDGAMKPTGGCKIRSRRVASAEVKAKRKVPAIRPGTGAISRQKRSRSETFSALNSDTALSHNGGGGFPDSEQCLVRILNANAHGKARSDMHPVQSVLDVGEPVAESRILGRHAKAKALHDSVKTLGGLTHHVHVDVLSRPNGLQLRFPVVGDDIPRAVIDQGEDGHAGLGIFAFGDVEVGYVSVEGRPDGATLQIELCITDLRRFGRPLCEQGVENLHGMHALLETSPRGRDGYLRFLVGESRLAFVRQGLLEPGLRLLIVAVRDPGLSSAFVYLLGRYILLGQKWFDTPQITCGECLLGLGGLDRCPCPLHCRGSRIHAALAHLGLGLRTAHAGARRTDRTVLGCDSALGIDNLGLQ